MELPFPDRELRTPSGNPEVDASGKRALITGAAGGAVDNAPLARGVVSRLRGRDG